MVNKVIHGDCLEVLKTLEENSVDSIVTDPPAGISFMGKSWDSDKGGRDNWIKWMSEIAAECKRVLKPGGHAFVWAIPRTSHWTSTAWENAGFEIRDIVAHIFGSGFPKSLNIGKAVDKLQGNEREVVGISPNDRPNSQVKGGRAFDSAFNEGQEHETINITKGTSEWEGWGTALKPAREDWILMRKPIECKTVAENVLKYGTGGINIDESRVGTEERTYSINGATKGGNFGNGANQPADEREQTTATGRFPANLIHDNSEEVRECFPETKSQQRVGKRSGKETGIMGAFLGQNEVTMGHNDSGNASRFFKSIIYQAKSSKSDRSSNGSIKNFHPTCKPTALMEYLIKMVTPKGGVVLDPFAGSGSTLVAAKRNGYQFIGIELTEEYIPIIEARLNSVKQQILI